VGAEGVRTPTFACKGEKEVLVRALSCENVVSLSTAEYLGVPSARYAGVMHAAVSPAMEERMHESPRSMDPAHPQPNRTRHVDGV
jgi:hypothetical protein